MNTGSMIAIYMPIFILFFVIIPQQNNVKISLSKVIKRRRGVVKMTNEVIKKYLGKTCYISSGNLGISTTGKIVDVQENWIEVETKKGNELINIDFVQSIKVKEA